MKAIFSADKSKMEAALLAGGAVATQCVESSDDIFTRQIAFLPERFRAALKKIPNVWEIRLRKNCPVTVFFGKKSPKYAFGNRVTLSDKAYLGENGATDRVGLAITATENDLASCLRSLSGNAVYRISDDLRRGALYGTCGVRIGVSGRAVMENGKVLSIAEVTSLCVRIPMPIFGNAAQVAPFLQENGSWCSTLIFSPPAGGKTTLLRDFARMFSENERTETIVIDERGELSAGQTFCHADVIAQMPKKESLSVAIRSLHPDVILTDEIMGKEDAKAVLLAIRAGITVFCSVHGNDLSAVLAAYPELCEMQRYIGLVQENGLRYAMVHKNKNDNAPQKFLLSARLNTEPGQKVSSSNHGEEG